ncbi:dnaJ protein ERDJ3A [Diospyros lotus]|uniref:dnaJ protein ERDJ3A n=1 Tax=Diospyros lotus TaxID=55363 RepID=UPI00225C246D|nr:dnaJ protein ERDJ3A [Diospyros lotus]
MKIRSAFPVIFCASFLIFSLAAKTLDPYKVLGVERNANQREIQKAFHKLSLQYHPDKNKNKGAQEKFAEINNAYDILSDEEKRKNYDLYGDEKGNPGFQTGNTGDQGGYTYFTNGGPGQGGFTFRPQEWQTMGGHGGSKSFSFSFGGPGGQNSFGFGLDDVFSNLFGGGMGGENWFGSSTQAKSGSTRSHKSIRAVNSQVYKKEIIDKGMTWLLLSYTPTLKGTEYYESIIEEVANSFQGALKVGSINCQTELSFSKDLDVYARKAPRVFVYSYRTSDSGSLLEYNGDLTAKNLKTFCREHLPRFSKHIDLSDVELYSSNMQTLPKVVLLSTKKDTPVIWRVISGLYRKRFAFYDAEVHHVSDPTVRRMGVDALPAVVGWLPNGEKYILKTGISVKDVESAVQDLSALLDGFEKKNENTAFKSKNAYSESGDKQMPLLTGSNFGTLCGETTPVCIVGAFRSARARDKLEAILLSVSQKSFSRRRNLGTSGGDSISYSLVDASKYPSFLKSLDRSGFRSSDKLLVAYKPRKGKYAAFAGELTAEEVERFIGSVLNGDVQFTKTRQKPTFN